MPPVTLMFKTLVKETKETLGHITPSELWYKRRVLRQVSVNAFKELWED